MTQTWGPPPSPAPPPQPGEAPFSPPSNLMRNPVIPGAVMTVLGGLLIVFGSFMPWITITAPLIGTLNVSGMQGGGDGVFTLGLGVVTILIAVTRLTATSMPIVFWRSSVITGAITAMLAGFAYAQVEDRIATAKEAAGEFSSMIVATVGPGLWMLFIGAAFAIFGGILVRKLPKA